MDPRFTVFNVRPRFIACGQHAPYPTLRVRSIVEAHVVDSLWSDSVWVWNGACEGAARSFRFEFPTARFVRWRFLAHG